MKKIMLGLMAIFMLCMMTATALAASAEKIQKERSEIDALSAKTLQNLYSKVPSQKTSLIAAMVMPH